MKILSTLIILSTFLISCNSPAQKSKETKQQTFEITKTDAEWKAQLSPEAYNVMRQEGTERAFSSPLNDNHKQGTYVCAACGTPLYESEHKFESGTGWPSFDRVIEGNVAFSTDNKLGYTRTEEHCATCGGHLGHEFDDGPKETTGKRHCINGVALNFIPDNGESK
ncbi:peptide-methionine (R)-S-oxide reductase MsrB [Aequorivita lipolytica]|uniref:peptide-methionine (R)-S-oxide reductase n=1 Tax=Aequorivita lipolytica TaxID=153267 RepID=A0A5C6YLX7_9FLAO|nr:peptide-methionine (R)-S-oxide reductase MsrB [Aequorivita lipolytica]TXD68380.1 peptide-methionine (R)-S-oxide reductase MsrB [Aequorivita lipolytica]SRX51477.1 Peptide methionine sulfoxide reductase MsrB [Aequorivita lipolytica]